MTRTDAELLQAARQDPTAFREFYDRYAVWMRAWLLRQTGSESAALDLTAETFAQAWHASRRFKDMAGGSGAPWLFGIARNLVRQYHKHNRIETAARERRMIRFAASAAGAALGRLFARSAGVERPQVRWRYAHDEPWFDNQVASLVLEDRRARFILEKTVPGGHDHGDLALERVFEYDLNPQG